MSNFTHQMKMKEVHVKAILIVCMAIALAHGMGGCVSWRATSDESGSGRVAVAQHPDLKKLWGIEITSLRLSGHGHLIDFRYRVVDPGKAALLGDRRYQPSLIDQGTGVKMKIPNTPKLGPLRQSASRLEVGKIYYMLFANAGMIVKPGSKVTVEIGDFKVEALIVE